MDIVDINIRPRWQLIFFYSIFLFILTACGASEEVVVQYQYDSLGRLNQVDDTVNGNRIYYYDAAGNRTQLSVISASTSSSGSTKPITPPIPLPPTNAWKNKIANCAYSPTWDAMPNTKYYEWSDSNGVRRRVEHPATSATLPCSDDIPQPNWVRSCNAQDQCSIDVFFQ